MGPLKAAPSPPPPRLIGDPSLASTLLSLDLSLERCLERLENINLEVKTQIKIFVISRDE